MANIIFLLIFFGLLFCAIGSIVIWSVRNGISPMPTSPKAKESLLQLLPKELKGSVYELGSGWGTLAIPLAEKLPNCKVVGFETSPIPFFISTIRSRRHRLPNLNILQQDFLQAPLGEASLVVCYLYPGAMKKLKSKFEKELKPGTWVISNTFTIPGWTPRKIEEVGDLYNTKIYLYRKG